MKSTVRVTVLVENSAQSRDLLGEHGLAYWVEADGRAVLFDTGQGRAIGHNAVELGAELSKAEAVALSHGHYDHTGGLPVALEASPEARVYAHFMTLQPKYARGANGQVRGIGIPPAALRALGECGARTIWTTRPAEVLPGVWLTGPIPRTIPEEGATDRFFVDSGCFIPDPLEDDQAMFFETEDGTVVLLGCAHAGVMNTLSYILRLTTDRPLHAVVGGMHLGNASPERIAYTLERLAALGVARLGPAHCTGRAATSAFWTAFPERCFACAVGTRLNFIRKRNPLLSVPHMR